ncbi:hypothetical protein HMPREF1544_02620 [Mucor circinelloides 1006PhL]|uniref:Uncharacterized protein n=1 Tax=Mucor circinelloides f. circinelloides (strain 1006PhL) TaxID=1220926 RepID=S2KDX7_MUCC1|nr:hypothetical protein HMPREF1544_02620 [Mucor circinelloides 1006PhL]
MCRTATITNIRSKYNSSLFTDRYCYQLLYRSTSSCHSRKPFCNLHQCSKFAEPCEGVLSDTVQLRKLLCGHTRSFKQHVQWMYISLDIVH